MPFSRDAGAGLSAAVDRELRRLGREPAALADADAIASLRHELAASPAMDSPALGLAKAVARSLVKQFGAAQSAKAIEHVRTLAAGHEARQFRHALERRAPRVLSPAPRGSGVPNNNISTRDRALAAIDAAVFGDGTIE